MLKEQPSIKVSTFANKFNVTPKTVRNDLKMLEEKGLVIRTFRLASLNPSTRKKALNIFWFLKNNINLINAGLILITSLLLMILC